VQVHRVLKNGVYFSSLVTEYNRHQRQVALEAMLAAATYRPVLEQAGDAIALLDAVCALAHVAAYSAHGYCRPILTDGDADGLGIELTAARHPCVELQENIELIPNGIRLVFGESNFLLVTGPNSK